jgi:hypothetical protein
MAVPQATAGRARPAQIHVQQRDIDGLVMCGEHGGVPYDLLGAALGVAPAPAAGHYREVAASRVRRDGPARAGPGPSWLTPFGMAASGLPYKGGPPNLGRLAHVRAVVAARLWLQAMPAWQQGRPWWQSERRIIRKGPFGGTHRPDAEVWWPGIDGSPYGDQVWAVEVELTAKNAARTAAVIDGYAAAGYHRVVYLTAAPARGAVARAAAGAAAPVTVHPLPQLPLEMHPHPPRITGLP